MMKKHDRLDGVLARNRKHLVLDVALAALFPLALLLSGAAFGAELPKLSTTTPAPVVDTAKTADAGQIAPDVG